MATANYLGKIHWVPEIGDPTIIGWVIVATYSIVALICLKAVFLSKENKPIKTFWLFLTIFLIALGINKQLDLQTLFTLIGKKFAIEQGWYKYRRIAQIAFIVFIGLMEIAALSFLLKIFKNASAEIKSALIGCTILFSFILIRAASFHHMDIFINIKAIGIKMNWLLELVGLAVIGISAFRYSYNKNSINSSL